MDRLVDDQEPDYQGDDDDWEGDVSDDEHGDGGSDDVDVGYDEDGGNGPSEIFIQKSQNINSSQLFKFSTTFQWVRSFIVPKFFSYMSYCIKWNKI